MVPGRGRLPELIHDARTIHFLRASRGAGETGDAFPDRVRACRPFGKTKLDQAEDLVGCQIHPFRLRTTRRALAALVTARNCFCEIHLSLYRYSDLNI